MYTKVYVRAHTILAIGSRLPKLKVKMGARSISSLAIVVLLLSTGAFVLPQAFSPQSTTPIQTSGAVVYGAPANGTRPLHVEGRWIKDDQGNIVILRGVAKGGFNNDPEGCWEAEGESFSQYRHIAWRESAVRYQYSIMRDVWGMNVMKWTFPAQWWVQNTGSFRTHVRNSILLAQEYGIYIIIVPYGVLAGTTADPMPFPPYAIHAGADAIIPNMQAFVNFWADVATYLGDLNNVIFDIWNEPNSGNQPISQAMTDWRNAWQQSVNAIRQRTDALVYIQWGYGLGAYQNLDWITQYSVTGANLVWGTHLYGPSLGNRYPQNATKEELQTFYQNNGLINAANAHPFLVEEIGALVNAEYDERGFIRNTLSILNDLQVGYIVWIWAPGPASPIPYGVLQNGPYVPQPSVVGQILVDAIRASG